MQEYNSEEISEIAKALINVQRQLQPATKNANNPFTKRKYDLEQRHGLVS